MRPNGTRSSSAVISTPREFVAFWLHEGGVVAGMNVNIWDVNEPIRELIRSRRAVDRSVLADPGVPIADSSPSAASRVVSGRGERAHRRRPARSTWRRPSGPPAELLAALGADLDSEHLRETPRRVAQAYAELLTPVPFNATTFPNDEGYDELVLVRDIPFQSPLRPPPAAVPRHRAASPICRASGSSASRSSAAWSTCSRATCRCRSG